MRILAVRKIACNRDLLRSNCFRAASSLLPKIVGHCAAVAFSLANDRSRESLSAALGRRTTISSDEDCHCFQPKDELRV